MTARELVEWELFYGLEPFGDEIADARHGILCTLVANGFMGLGGKRGRFKPKDFHPWRRPPIVRQTAAQMRAFFEAFAARFQDPPGKSPTPGESSRAKT